MDDRNFFVMSGILYSGEHILSTLFQQNKTINVRYDKLIDFDQIDFNKKTLDVNVNWVKDDNFNIVKNNINSQSKIICTVREPAEVAAFLLSTRSVSNVKAFLKTSEIINKLKNSYILFEKFYEKNKDDIILIKYEDIISNTKDVMKQLHKMFELDDFEYDYDLLNYCEKINTEEILGEFFDEMDPPTFWDSTVVKPKKDIEIQLQLSLEGKMEEAKYYLDKMEREKPSCDRAAFNRGWYKMQEGKLLEGHRLLDRGRNEGAIGTALNKLPMHKPIWNGKNKERVIYYMEGGFGDQIHSIKYINKIKEIAGDVVIHCAPELTNLLVENGYNNIIDDFILLTTVEFDSWVPAMSAICSLGYEYKDLDGRPYLKNKRNKQNDKFTIGLKWSGNPQFEHQQHRKFPLDLFFDSVYNEKFDYVSLQRDEESDLCPEWVKKTNLDTWVDTQVSVSNCDLVITSCTSIAHLSAAIGIPTWIIIPILPYYLWALPGKKTPHYDSVTLFRQQKFNDWTYPLNEIKTRLNVL
jgi:hypothetical protein